MSAPLVEIWVFLAQSPLLWLSVTLVAYTAALWLHQRSGANPVVNPVLVAVLIVVTVLTATRTPYGTYFEGAKFVHFLIGPATVALAVPLYGQLERLRRVWLPVTVALLVGCVAAIASAVAIAWALGGSRELLLSLAPKSATMPIAMAASERVGGVPSLTAMAVVVTGVVGTLAAGPVLRALRIDDAAVAAFTLGLTAHAIGTARALQADPATVAFAALAMSANGLATALVMALLPRWL